MKPDKPHALSQPCEDLLQCCAIREQTATTELQYWHKADDTDLTNGMLMLTCSSRSSKVLGTLVTMVDL